MRPIEPWLRRAFSRPFRPGKRGRKMAGSWWVFCTRIFWEESGDCFWNRFVLMKNWSLQFFSPFSLILCFFPCKKKGWVWLLLVHWMVTVDTWPGCCPIYHQQAANHWTDMRFQRRFLRDWDGISWTKGLDLTPGRFVGMVWWGVQHVTTRRRCTKNHGKPTSFHLSAKLGGKTISSGFPEDFQSFQ